jgi:4-hydroxythreonine-4-phosphate dehydrogenase
MNPLSASMDSKLRILISTGDADGIGWEVTAKALHALGPKKGVQFFFYRPPAKGKQPKLSSKFKHLVASSLEDAALLPFDSKTAVEIRSSQPPAFWVEEAARACLRKEFQALVTAPLSKTSIASAGLKDIGHTEILARVSGKQDLFMGFWGRKFSVVLASGHLSLLHAVSELHPERLRLAIRAGLEMRKLLAPAKRKLPVALVGLNPHAGEQGLIGNEEEWMSTVAAEFPAAVGPLVPDTAFLPQNWTRYSVYICPYHDQGLIPFKMIHGFSGGVHLTLGLPFVRTSVDHGTAKELFGKNKAQYGSMKDALVAAIQLGKEQDI